MAVGYYGSGSTVFGFIKNDEWNFCLDMTGLGSACNNYNRVCVFKNVGEKTWGIRKLKYEKCAPCS